jgi:hypothetical protein
MDVVESLLNTTMELARSGDEDVRVAGFPACSGCVMVLVHVPCLQVALEALRAIGRAGQCGGTAFAIAMSFISSELVHARETTISAMIMVCRRA